MAATMKGGAEETQRIITEPRREGDAVLARGAALADVLGVINRSPGDPGPAFEAILEKAMLLCGASFGELHTFDGRFFRAAAPTLWETHLGR